MGRKQRPTFNEKEEQALAYLESSAEWYKFVLHSANAYDSARNMLRKILNEMEHGIGLWRASWVIRQARESWAFYRALFDECLARFETGTPVPEELRHYTVAAVTGREKPPRKRRETSIRDIFLAQLIDDVSNKFKIAPTRNPGTTDHHSVCSLLATRKWISLGEAALNSVWLKWGKQLYDGTIVYD
jgi:hypothetical protein